MAIFKCKMCGGTIEIQQGESVGVCEYCGTKQTLPKLDDERKVNLYDRANHFRRNNDFDKAMGIYEQILNEDGTDAEAYWSLVLCRYGIEYVEDPATQLMKFKKAFWKSRKKKSPLMCLSAIKKRGMTAGARPTPFWQPSFTTS